MEKDYLIQPNTNAYKLAIGNLIKAFPRMESEIIKEFFGYGSREHIGWTYVMTDKYLYMFDAANGMRFSSEILVKIPLNNVKKIGCGEFGFNTASYVILKDNMVIPLKVYNEIDEVKKSTQILDETIKSMGSCRGESDFYIAERIMVKPIMKKSEYVSDYLSPYQYCDMGEKKWDYLKKMEKLIKKIQKKISC